jgi:hypothetical protein
MNIGGTKGYTTISNEEYENLLEDSLWLSALEAAGVDNWQGYESAREIYQEMVEET